MKNSIKNKCSLAAGLLLAFSTAPMATATTGGFVFCDANQNGQIDSGDVPMTGVLIVVTNLSGTFSNANFSSTPDGGFAIALGGFPDTYIEYIHPLTLPADATVVEPAGGLYKFYLDGVTNTEFLGNFLVSSASCATNPPPPPPPPQGTNNCCLKGGGTIGCSTGGKGHKSQPQYAFEGSVLPSCGCTNGDSGEWNVVAAGQKLHFEGSVFEIVNCGSTQAVSSCTSKFIEFQGAGTLLGIGGCKTNYGVVSFYGRAEDNGNSRRNPDRLYFRVDTADGTTVLLISGDSSNPMNIVPVALSSGDLRISTSCCETKGNSSGGNGHGEGEGEGGDHGKGSGNGNGNGNCNNGNSGNGNGNGQGQGEGDHGKGNGGGNGNGGDQGSGHGNGNGQGHGTGGNGNGNSNGSGSGNCDTGHGQGNGHKKGK